MQLSEMLIICSLKQKYLRLVELLINVLNLLRLRRQIRLLVISNVPIKLVIGAGGTRLSGWVNTDLPVFDALCSIHWRFVFSNFRIDRILAEHVVEHWTETQFRTFLNITRQFLSEGAFIRLAVPDGFHPDPGYIEGVRPNGIWAGADDHKMLYDYVFVTKLLSEEKYGCRLLEYFDESGQFHCTQWDVLDGFIERSAFHDPRNGVQQHKYTSLIFDIWPI